MWIGNKNKATCRDGLYPRVCLANLCNWLNHNTKAAKRDLHHLVFKAVLWLFFPMLESQKKNFRSALATSFSFKNFATRKSFFRNILQHTVAKRHILLPKTFWILRKSEANLPPIMSVVLAKSVASLHCLLRSCLANQWGKKLLWLRQPRIKAGKWG